MSTLISLGKATLIVSVAAYFLVCAVLYLLQTRLIFPGAYSEVPLRLANAVLPADFKTTKVLSADGTALFVLHRAPQPGRPIVLLFHGNASYPEDYAFLYRSWARDGFGVVAPVARGYPRSQGSPDGESMLDDALAVRDWIEADYPGHRVFVFGQSLGTGPAVHVAAHRTTAGLVLISPFLSMASLVSSKLPWVPVGVLLASPFRSDRDIASVAAPIVIFHGSEDTTIPLGQAEALAALARSPLTFVTIDRADHVAGLFDTDMINKVEQFLSAATP